MLHTIRAKHAETPEEYDEQTCLQLAELYHKLRIESQKKIFLVATAQRLPQNFVNSRNQYEHILAMDQFWRETGKEMRAYELSVHKHKLTENEAFKQINQKWNDAMKVFVESAK